jgi:PleD family two-component response regulator
MSNEQRLADLPSDERRALEAAQRREISDGLTGRHLANAADSQRYLAAQFARILRAGSALAAKLRGE